MSTTVSAVRRPAESARGPHRLALWYSVFTVHAGAVALLSGPGNDRTWGIWAVVGYAVAFGIAARWRTRGADVALVVGAAGGLLAPVIWLASKVSATPDVQVVERAATMLLHHGTPYLSAADLSHTADVIAYNPYLPCMAVFGLPHALGLPSIAGDTRLWLAAATIILFTLAFRIAGRSDAFRYTLLVVASPVVAMPVALGITDPPVLAALCFALALLGRAGKPVWAAAFAIGVVCAMKATAWPALPVLAAMLAAREGMRTAARFAAAALGTAVVLVIAFAPADLGRPSAMFQNTVLFPLGLTHVQTPAASPLPGHLLATLGSGGRAAAIILLIAAGLAVAVSLYVRPPTDGPAAARRLAIGLILLFALSPATRFGYFAYPIGLYGWLILSGTPSERELSEPG